MCVFNGNRLSNHSTHRCSHDMSLLNAKPVEYSHCIGCHVRERVRNFRNGFFHERSSDNCSGIDYNTIEFG